jgi:ABC-type nitrate/sulfonate/bicarbonate transport system permease component
LRISVVLAFLGAVLAGIIGGAPGLGRDLMYAQLNGDSTASFAIVIFMGIIGMVIGGAVTWAQRKIVFWVPS